MSRKCLNLLLKNSANRLYKKKVEDNLNVCKSDSTYFKNNLIIIREIYVKY